MIEPDFKIDEYLFVWHKQGYKRIAIDDITHLKAARSYCEIFTKEKQPIVVSIPLGEVLGNISGKNFIRIHRSFAINLRYVDSLIGNTIYINDGSKLTIGREYRKDFFARLIFVGAKPYSAN